jgi:ATP synthase protein I
MADEKGTHDVKNIALEHEKLEKSIQQDIDRLEKAKKERNSILAQVSTLGVIGLAFVLPIVIGAYLGIWLDNKLTGFSISWTISLIFVGIIVGAINVYLMLKD